jgi:hypothetical protein
LERGDARVPIPNDGGLSSQAKQIVKTNFGKLLDLIEQKL